jgi:hypothetical protein
MGLIGGRSCSYDDMMAVNLSFVLHEESTSRVVQRAVKISKQHRPGQISHIVRDGNPETNVTLWLAPSVGAVSDVETALNSDSPLLQIDSGTGPTRNVNFFGAPARLTLPGSENQNIGIVALVIRPGRKSSLLITRGPFTWPDQEQEVVRELEAIIQAHAEQWQPAVQLWPAAAEALLEDFRGH